MSLPSRFYIINILYFYNTCAQGTQYMLAEQKIQSFWKGCVSSAKQQQQNWKCPHFWPCSTWTMQDNNSGAFLAVPSSSSISSYDAQGSLTSSVKLLMRHKQSDFGHSPTPPWNLISKHSLDQHVRIRVYIRANLTRETLETGRRRVSLRGKNGYFTQRSSLAVIV